MDQESEHQAPSLSVRLLNKKVRVVCFEVHVGFAFFVEGEERRRIESSSVDVGAHGDIVNTKETNTITSRDADLRKMLRNVSIPETQKLRYFYFFSKRGALYRNSHIQLSTPLSIPTYNPSHTYSHIFSNRWRTRSL